MVFVVVVAVIVVVEIIEVVLVVNQAVVLVAEHIRISF